MNTIKELIKNPSTVIVDVRSPWEFESGHVTGAKNIPLEEVPGKISDFKEFQTPIVFYCRSGNRSGMAVSILKQNGLTDIYNGGGLEDVQSLLN
ncbi:MAG TPA: rhodanese-like domain-containing protein [Chitinophagaceae bacterium]|nr:rhodanese-like domain-containing protein [Chitinophagales bacterium]HPG10276.1 rhodanese-like domain-containing protein [Chitinophagaceae bacterium]